MKKEFEFYFNCSKKPFECFKQSEKNWFLFLDCFSGKAMVFVVVMYRCESWTTKKAEC